MDRVAVSQLLSKLNLHSNIRLIIPLSHVMEYNQLYQVPIYLRLARLLDVRHLSQLISIDQAFQKIAKSGGIWREWALAHPEQLQLAFLWLLKYSHNDNPELTRIFVQNGANVNVGDYSVGACADGYDACAECFDPLNLTIRYRGFEIFKLLVDNGAEIQTEDDDYEMCAGPTLTWAAECNNMPVLKHLVETGGDIHARDEQALYCAIDSGSFDAVMYLLDCGANLRTVMSFSTVRTANFRMLQLLIKHGADVNAVFDGQCLIERALELYLHLDENLAYVKLLLDRGVIIPERCYKMLLMFLKRLADPSTRTRVLRLLAGL